MSKTPSTCKENLILCPMVFKGVTCLYSSFILLSTWCIKIHQSSLHCPNACLMGSFSSKNVISDSFFISNDAIFLPFDRFCQMLSQLMRKWASSCDYGTYHIGDQQRLRRACTSAQSHQSLRCSHTWSMEVDEVSDQKIRHLALLGLRMHIWRMSIRRINSTIISWHGSNDCS